MMYIPDNSELEKGMQISYGDLVEELKVQNKKALERKQKLQADATHLLNELKKWLYLPEYDFVDDEGRPHSYLDVYVKNPNGLFEKRPPQGLQTDKNHVLNFNIGLLLSGDGITTGWIYVPIEMFYKGGTLYVISGEERSHVQVMHGPDQGRLFEAATMVKNSFLSAIKDPNLK